MPIREGREYRNFNNFEIRSEENQNYKVRGYASTFEEYELFEFDGVKYCERIDPSAFEECDMSDVIFLYNHEGMVYARSKNGTLELGIDSHGFWIEADLGTTEMSRQMCEQIRARLIDQMSFAFVVGEDEIIRTNDKTVRLIKQLKKVYDVSAVSIPANDGTDISVVSARSSFDGEIEARKAERLEREKALAVAKAKYFYFNEVN